MWRLFVDLIWLFAIKIKVFVYWRIYYCFIMVLVNTLSVKILLFRIFSTGCFICWTSPIFLRRELIFFYLLTCDFRNSCKRMRQMSSSTFDTISETLRNTLFILLFPNMLSIFIYCVEKIHLTCDKNLSCQPLHRS